MVGDIYIINGDRHNWWGQTLLVGIDIIGGYRNDWWGQTNIASLRFSTDAVGGWVGCGA